MQALSHEVAAHLGLQLGAVRIKRFADGEIYVQVQESIRGCDVFLLQPTCPTQVASVNDSLMELMVMVDACRYDLRGLLWDAHVFSVLCTHTAAPSRTRLAGTRLASA